jgi:hypothetical protein
MVSYITQQQHSLSKIQAKKEPVKAVSNLLSNHQDVSWNDLRGLHWTLFEEGKYHD